MEGIIILKNYFNYEKKILNYKSKYQLQKILNITTKNNFCTLI